MQKLSEVPDMKRGYACAKKRKESCSLSAVTSGVTAPTSFLLVVESVMHRL